MSETVVEAFLDDGREPALVGHLYLHRRRGVQSASFRYDDAWLASEGAHAIDPQLPLLSGAQHTAVGQALFRAFADSAPDRWGVELTRRFENRRAASAGTMPRLLSEADFLLAVRDDLRQGALRLRDPVAGVFLAPSDRGVPHLVDLPRLLSASARLDDDADSDDDLRLLLDAGSSLGGARPKAHVVDAGRLLIAKFPRLVDPWSVIVWERIALEMAAAAGIRTPASRLEHIAGRPVLLLERFDRTGAGARIGYVSALTMLEASDRDRRAYTEIAEVIETSSSRAGDDLRELWRRVAFSILISNTDDHLRNHGFLRSGPGWMLSPVFDLNPAPDSAGLMATAIDDPRDRTADIDRLVSWAPYFRVTDPRAELAAQLAATDDWQARAARHGVAGEVDRLRPAFEHAQRARARQIAGV
ncbi:MAG: type II toxin-antitoxin system HipA family toxin [Thermoleophilia bacterium]|jgi:serine/threonine-protein kinase HipA